MFLLLLVFALLLKLLHALRKRSYLEHFVFALHLHAFVFLLFIAVLLIRAPYVAGIVAGVIAIYSFIAITRLRAGLRPDVPEMVCLTMSTWYWCPWGWCSR